MLRELRIRNYAVIERLELVIDAGLVAFTGETGAGKSIIIGALALALGGRSQPDQVRAGGKEAVVEALFLPPLPQGAATALAEAGLGAADGLILRRVVPSSGKSRAFVNDSAVSLATLDRIGRELVDIHGQHQHQSLLRPETHLDFLDGYGKLFPLRLSFADRFRRWGEARRELARLSDLEREKARRLDFLLFQKEEIGRAGLRAGEDEDLRAEREVLRNAERLAAAAGEAEDLIYSGEPAAAGMVSRAAELLADLAGVDPALGPMSRLLAECQVQLEETGREIQAYCGGLESRPERLGEVDDRLDELARLKRKYGGSVEEILGRLEEIEGELDLLERGEERRAGLERELESLAGELSAAAADLTRRRQAGRRRLEGKVLAELEQLGLAGSRFEVDLRQEEDGEGLPVDGKRYLVDERGTDRAEFLLSANPGEPLRPLSRVASGGELSRIMLAIKTVLAEVDHVPTLVFDEVDIGIGGKTARLVGDRLRAVSRGRQVLCVTHLPQIASLADSHYNIGKSTRKGRAHISVTLLDGEGRTEEVARMLGGRKVTAAVRRHAAEMLQERT